MDARLLIDCIRRGALDNLAIRRSELAQEIAMTDDATPETRQQAMQLAEAAVSWDETNEYFWAVLGLTSAADSQWGKSLDAFKHHVDLGGSEIPALNLSRIKELADENDASCRELMDFLDQHGLSNSSEAADNSA